MTSLWLSSQDAISDVLTFLARLISGTQSDEKLLRFNVGLLLGVDVRIC